MYKCIGVCVTYTMRRIYKKNNKHGKFGSI